MAGWVERAQHIFPCILLHSQYAFIMYSALLFEMCSLHQLSAYFIHQWCAVAVFACTNNGRCVYVAIVDGQKMRNGLLLLFAFMCLCLCVQTVNIGEVNALLRPQIKG